MANADDKNLLLTQVQTDVSLISFFSVVSVFFVGSLLPKFGSYDLSVKIPISFLIVSTFSFLFSGLILANVSSRIIEGKSEAVRKYMAWGYAVSEYLGIYLFILSIPLAVSIITADPYLRVVTFCAAVIGLSFYQFMGFSLLEKYFSRRNKILATLVIIFGIGLFAAQIFAFHFVLISVVFLCFILLVTILAPMKSFQ